MARRMGATISVPVSSVRKGAAPVPFTKMHGLGNDFAVVDAVADVSLVERDDWQADVPAMCNRRTGIGADGVLIVSRKRDGGRNDFHMRVINADGSEPEMCGNGLRCVARLVTERGYTGDGPLRIETAGVTRLAEASQDGDGQWNVTVDMGAPGFGVSEVGGQSAKLRALGEHEFELAVPEAKKLNVVLVSTGNPHAVAVFGSAFLLNEMTDAALTKLGSAIEQHEAFPNGINAQFAHARSNDEIDVRTWERGCGITRACGSGACAAAVACMLLEMTSRDVAVNMVGGTLRVRWNESDNHMLMTGPAQRVYEGVWAGAGCET